MTRLFLTGFIEDKSFNADFFSKDLYGVLPLRGRKKQQIDFRINAQLSNYFQANPIHHSQEVIKYYEYGTIDFRIEVTPTLELLNDFFMYSTSLTVLKPSLDKTGDSFVQQKSMENERFFR